MATFTLENLREAADRKYAPTIIETPDRTYTLPNLLRLAPEKRSEIEGLLADAEKYVDEDASGSDLNEQIELFEKLLIAAEVDGKGQELLDLIDDPAIVMDIVTEWLEATQAGEAES